MKKLISIAAALMIFAGAQGVQAQGAQTEGQAEAQATEAYTINHGPTCRA